MEKIIYKFDYGIDDGGFIEDSNYFWYTSEHGLKVKNLVDQSDKLTYSYKIGSLSNDKFETILAKNFKFNNQNYIFLSVNVNSNENIIIVYELSKQKVILAAETPMAVIRADIIVKNNNESSFLSNFEVCAVCACTGGTMYLIDITPNESMQCDEYNPVDLAFYSINDEINRAKHQATKLNKLYALFLNELYCDRINFKYTLPNEQVLATIPQENVKITSLQYEKQIDSLLVGFNFGSFQIWNMKSLSIESSSSYGQLNRPIVGFSIMEPQNDPKKCIYLLTAYSTLINDSRMKADENEIDDIDEEDDENDSSFVLLYQLNYEKKKKISSLDDKKDSFTFYENLTNCIAMFESDLTSETLATTNTNNFNYDGDEFLNELKHDTALSKIISINTLRVRQNDLEVDLALFFWTIIEKKSHMNCIYYLTVFNLNNWYSNCMPYKLDKAQSNLFINSFLLNLNVDYQSIKHINVIDSNIKRLKSIDDDTILSFYFEIMALNSFNLIKYTIRPVEEQLRSFISRQENVFEYKNKIYNLLYQHNLLGNRIYEDKSLAIFDFLIENSEMSVLMKSLKKLEKTDTSLLSSFSLKTVLDWSWNKFKEMRNQIKDLTESLVKLNDEDLNYIRDNLNHSYKILGNLIRVFALFIQLNQSNDGFVELNKKQAIIKSFESYVQHLIILLDLDLLPESKEQSSDFTKCKLISFSKLQDQWYEKRKTIASTVNNPIYQHTLMIDLLINDCKSYAMVSNLVRVKHYPPKSIYELVEIFLETNLNQEIKECLFLYFLIDIYHHTNEEIILNFIQNYHSSFADSQAITQYLSDFVFGIYYFDNNDLQKAYEHLRKCDLTIVQANEKYLILYNLVITKNWKLALNFLWLFDNLLKDRETSSKDLEFFEIYSKLFISIYMSNNFVNEAFELVKYVSNNQTLFIRLFVYFLVKSEEFHLWSDVVELLSTDKTHLNILFSYLEAKSDIKSICVAIDLYLNNDKNYEAVTLYDKYARQILSSPYSYLSGMIEVIKEMNVQPSNENFNRVLLTKSDLKDAQEHLNSRPLLTKGSSKRCNRVLSDTSDYEYFELIQLMKRETFIQVTSPKNLALPASSSSISILKSNLSNDSLLSERKSIQTPMRAVKFQLLEEKNNVSPKETFNRPSPKKVDASPGFKLILEDEEESEKNDESIKESRIDETLNQDTFDSTQSIISSKSANDLATRLLEVQTPAKNYEAIPTQVQETPPTPINNIIELENEDIESEVNKTKVLNDVNESIENEPNERINEKYTEKDSSFTVDIAPDEKITSVSDEENDPLQTSMTSTVSQATTISEFDSASQQQPKVAKVKRRKSQIEKLLEAQNDSSSALDTPRMMTRSKLKALNTPQKVTIEDNPRLQRQTRSVTRSPPSPTESVVSTASTTVARNSIKRRGSNRIKKPSVVLSPTESNDKKSESEFKEEASTRYNLRSRIKTPKKDDIEEDDVEASSSSQTTPKKTRKSIKPLTARKNNLYKIDESEHAINEEFTFSQPNINSQRSTQSSQKSSDKEEDPNSSFTFSPPRASNAKKL